MTDNKPTEKAPGFISRHPILSNLVFIAITAVVLVWLAMIFLDVWTDHGATTIVPDIKKNSYAMAKTILEKEGLSIEISDSIYDESITLGTVIESWPHAGAKVKPGREIYVTITSFQPRKVSIGMPLTGVSSRQALSYLESLSIKNIRIVNVPSQYADLVEGAKYNGKDITLGMQLPVTATVTLEVGSVPEEFFNEPAVTDTVLSTSGDDFDDLDARIEAALKSVGANE